MNLKKIRVARQSQRPISFDAARVSQGLPGTPRLGTILNLVSSRNICWIPLLTSFIVHTSSCPKGTESDIITQPHAQATTEGSNSSVKLDML